MQIRLWRIFHLLRPDHMVLLAISVIAMLSSGFASNFDPAAIIAFSSVLFLMICSLLFYSPKKLEIQNGSFIYTERCFLYGFHFHLRRRAPVTFTVERVRSIDFKQNPIEKLFGVGHIRLDGWTTYTADERYVDNIKDREVHRIYGIPHFKEFQKAIYEKLNTGEIARM